MTESTYPVATVIVCAHNPRPAYLARVLAALRSQTLTSEKWELLLVDNASSERLSGRFDLAWHPAGRHVHEPVLGLTQARLRGIAEARADILVFVDDDNVAAPDFLEQALAIGAGWPTLGAWGGSVEGEFETPPEDWTRGYWSYLAIRPCTVARWSNNPDDSESIPAGSGLCVRRAVATVYAAEVARDPLRQRLGRRGTSLISGEDTDLVCSAPKLGLGFGRFPQPRMRHLMPPHRLTERYLLDLVRSIAVSRGLLAAANGRPIEPPRGNLALMLRDLLHLSRHGLRDLRFRRADRQGLREARRLIRSLDPPAGDSFRPASR